MSKITQTDRKIVFTEQLSAAIRIFLALIGLAALLLAPYELLIRPQWHGFSPLFAFVLLISIGAILIGGLFIAAGLLGLNQIMTVDYTHQTLAHVYQSALTPLRRKVYRFDQVTSVELAVHDWSDGPATYGIKFKLRDGQKIEIGSLTTKEDAAQVLSKLENWLKPDPATV